jgi:hypothetical protein
VHPGIDYLVMGVVLNLCDGPRCDAYYQAHVDAAVDAIEAEHRLDAIEPGMIPEREPIVKGGADERLDGRAPHNAASVFPA